jgi:hypothetical protein
MSHLKTNYNQICNLELRGVAHKEEEIYLYMWCKLFCHRLIIFVFISVLTFEVQENFFLEEHCFVGRFPAFAYFWVEKREDEDDRGALVEDTGQNRSTRKVVCSTVTLLTTNLTWIGPGSIPVPYVFVCVLQLLSAFARLRKATSSFVMLVSPSLRPSAWNNSLLVGFLWNLIFEHFSKIYPEN